MSRQTGPVHDNLVTMKDVRSVLGRDPLPSDLDQMAENGVFLTREDRLVYDIFGSFENVPERMLP